MNIDSVFISSTNSTSYQEIKQTSKLILRSALQKANAAVQCDSTNDVSGAVYAYKEAIELLNKALNLVDKESDKRRLQEIHDSYSERIRLLTEQDEDWRSNSTSLQKTSLRKMTSTEFKNNDRVPLVLKASRSTPLQPNPDRLDLERQVKTKHVPSLILPSSKKEDSVTQKYRERTSSLPKAPQSHIYTAEAVEEESVEPRKTPKKTVERLSLDDLPRRKSSAYEHNNSFSFSYFLKDQTQNAEPVREDRNLTLIWALEKSMQNGAYITDNLYIPRSLWQQSNVRLSHVDIKISVCDTMRGDITRLENWNYLDDLRSSLNLLNHVENSVEGLRNSLSKKLKKDSSDKSLDGSNQTSSSSSNNHQTNTSKPENNKKASQSFMAWGTRLSKSVERMNAFGLSKG
ncbi:hypothetical protein BY458DRAFT_533472 [Sporodiniella umbellata]|nr:hypothetical protein BY458DRAFT_533472 [Sporodiniella umbellata]